MSGIHWTDVRPNLPQPHQAHDAQLGERRVEARHSIILAADAPYTLEFRLLESGRLVERWTVAYRTVNIATQQYAGAQMAAERWLQGARMQDVRPPGHLWTIEKGAP